MSADNWTICPKCQERKIREAREAREKASQSYGAVPIGEFLLLEQAAGEKEAAVKIQRRTLGEYARITSDPKGMLVLFYQAVCDNDGCNFKYTYNTEISMFDQDTPGYEMNIPEHYADELKNIAFDLSKIKEGLDADQNPREARKLAEIVTSLKNLVSSLSFE